MEAKQKAIKEAYGEYYESLENYINESGVFVGETYLISDELFEKWDFIASTPPIGKGKLISGSRPKELRGIENNNGWIKIESESDLPKEDCDCYIEHKDGSILIDKYSIDFEMFNFNYWRHIIAYQQIVKPKKRIY